MNIRKAVELKKSPKIIKRKITKNDDANNNDPNKLQKRSPTEIDKQLEENAELFKELLCRSKEDIKKARIQDASDYLLKFFEGTQEKVQHRSTAESGFATSRDSRTDKAKAAKNLNRTNSNSVSN